MIRTRLALLSLAAVLLTATRPSLAAGAVAPGHVVLSTAAKAPERNVDATGGGPSVALPDGGAIVLSFDRTFQGFTLVRLRADGSLEPSFGTGGIARVASPAGVASASQLLRRPDGRLIVVASGPAASKYELPRFVLLRLTADGAPDPSFGAGAIATTTLQNAGGGGAALGRDGSIVLSGTIGQVSAEIENTPRAPASFEWVVQRLTPAGALDASFGTVKIPGPAGLGTTGRGVVVRPSGQIVVLGSHANVAQVAGLTPGGAPDPTFNAGQPATVPGGGPWQLLLHPGGAIDVMTSERLTRFNVSGLPDPAFGAGGSVAVTGFERSLGPPSMLPAPGGSTILHRTAVYEPTPSPRPRLLVSRVGATGVASAVSGITAAFAGGIAGTRARLEQNSFRGGLLQRVDGSYLLVGGVSVVQYTGEGAGFSAGFLAVAAVDALLRPIGSFGGPQAAARARVRLPRQRVSADLRLRRVLVRVTASGPGLVSLRVRDGRRRILARTVAPVYKAGTTSVRIPLTATGRRILRSRRANVRVTAGHDFRDVLTARQGGAVAGRLR